MVKSKSKYLACEPYFGDPCPISFNTVAHHIGPYNVAGYIKIPLHMSPLYHLYSFEDDKQKLTYYICFQNMQKAGDPLSKESSYKISVKVLSANCGYSYSVLHFVFFPECLQVYDAPHACSWSLAADCSDDMARSKNFSTLISTARTAISPSSVHIFSVCSKYKIQEF